MSNISIDIPDEILDEQARKRIKDLEKKIGSLEQKLERRDRKIDKLKRDMVMWKTISSDDDIRNILGKVCELKDALSECNISFNVDDYGDLF